MKTIKIISLISLIFALAVSMIACETAGDTGTDLYIEDVENVESMTADYGTSKQSIINDLPETIEIKLSNGNTEIVELTWNTENYNGEEAGEYTLIGYYTVEGITDSIKVNVKVKDIAEDTEGKIILKIPDQKEITTAESSSVIPNEATHVEVRVHGGNRNIYKITELPDNVSEKEIEINVPIGTYQVDVITLKENGFRKQVLTMGSGDNIKVEVGEITKVNINLSWPEVDLNLTIDGEVVELGQEIEVGKTLHINYEEDFNGLDHRSGTSNVNIVYEYDHDNIDISGSEYLGTSGSSGSLELPVWDNEEIESVNFRFYIRYFMNHHSWSAGHEYYYPVEQFEDKEHYFKLIHPESGIIIEL